MASSSVVWTNTPASGGHLEGACRQPERNRCAGATPGVRSASARAADPPGRPAAILPRPGPRCAGERVPTAVTVWSTSSVGVRTHRGSDSSQFSRRQLVSREVCPSGAGRDGFPAAPSLSECVLPATTRPPLCRRHPGARPAVGGLGLIRALLRIGKINTLIAARGPALSLHPAPMRRRPADDSCDILRLTAGTRRRTRMKRLLCGRPASAGTSLIGRTTGACARGYSLMRNRQDACPLRACARFTKGLSLIPRGPDRSVRPHGVGSGSPLRLGV